MGIHDRDTKWDPTKKTFFVNEIEPSSTTYFARWLQHDCLPQYGRLYAQKAREIYRHLQAARATAADRKVIQMKSKANMAVKARTNTPKAKVTTPKLKVMKDRKLKTKPRA